MQNLMTLIATFFYITLLNIYIYKLYRLYIYRSDTTFWFTVFLPSLYIKVLNSCFYLVFILCIYYIVHIHIQIITFRITVKENQIKR